MMQIRVTSEFLDITCSNCRRKVGEVLIVSDERAAYLVNGNLCEYVVDEATEPKAAETEAPAEQTEPKAAETENPAEQKPAKRKGGKRTTEKTAKE